MKWRRFKLAEVRVYELALIADVEKFWATVVRQYRWRNLQIETTQRGDYMAVYCEVPSNDPAPMGQAS